MGDWSHSREFEVGSVRNSIGEGTSLWVEGKVPEVGRRQGFSDRIFLRYSSTEVARLRDRLRVTKGTETSGGVWPPSSGGHATSVEC